MINLYVICFFFNFLRSLKAKYRSLIIRKIIRELDQSTELPRTSILEAMIMLKAAWDEVTVKTIVNCFRKSGISEESRKGAMDDDDDPFREVADAVCGWVGFCSGRFSCGINVQN